MYRTETNSAGRRSNFYLPKMRLVNESGGQATILMALFMGLVMLGFLALAIDVGYLFRQKRIAQAAADAAAVAAAEEVTAGNSVTSSLATNAANVASTLNGFDTGASTNPAKVTLVASTAGNYSNADSGVAPVSWVQATVSKPVQSYFLAAFNHGMRTLNISATAIAAGGASSPTCICLTGTSGNDLGMSNNAKLNANQCGITANSSSSNAITVVGSASVSGTSVQAVSTNWNNSSNINNAGTICSTANRVQGAAACSSSLTPPDLPTGITCYNNPINGWVLPNWTANYTLPMQGVTETNGHVENEVATNGAICYNSLNLANAASVTFSPGYTYYILGDFTTGGGAPVTGNNVTFVISGTVNIANGVTVNLTAPTTNGVPGVLFYIKGSSTVTIQGGSNSNFSGIISAPNANMVLNNGTGTTTNMDIVAKTLTMAGGAALNSYATPALGGSSGGSGVAKLVQ
jgi:Flp pilus assembly protein TadG